MVFADGKNFWHNFGAFDKSLWMKQDKKLSCIEMQCFYAEESNLQWDSIRDYVDKSLHAFMSVRLKNDCIGEKCCLTNQNQTFCTYYTGGHLISKSRYGYGSYRILALAEGTVEWGYEYAARYCFGIAGSDSKGKIVKIVMCRFTHAPGYASLIWQNDRRIDVQEIELPRNIGNALSIMRLDWTPNNVKFYFKGNLIGFWDGKTHPLPDVPMKIVIFLVPDDMNSPKTTDVIDIEMNVYRFRYINWNNMFPTELFVTNESSSSTIFYFSLGCLTLVSLILLIRQWWLSDLHKCTSTNNDDHYKLVQNS